MIDLAQRYKGIVMYNPAECRCIMDDRTVELIIKDLEILDQLKEILSMDYLVRVYGYEMAKRLQTYLKSNDAVKRWLENDK